jgi:hypothetical protein
MLFARCHVREYNSIRLDSSIPSLLQQEREREGGRERERERERV